MRELCTYCDKNYLCQALALHQSLTRQPTAFRLWLLCLDETTYRIATALGLGDTVLIERSALLSYSSELREAEANRPELEFYYACTPVLVKYVLDRTEIAVGGVSYVDADMFFFGPLGEIFTEAPDADVLIVAHRSNDATAERERGRYNVCFVHFSRSDDARACLEWWTQATQESTRLGDGVWGDQKYLDEFPTRFRGVHVVESRGFGLAPWHFWGSNVTPDDRGGTLVDGSTLIAYHFARFLIVTERLCVPIRRDWLPSAVLRLVYRPYMRAISRAYSDIKHVEPAYRVGYSRHNWRGLILSIVTGRVFYEGKRGFWRVGVYLPAGSAELRSRRSHRARFAARRHRG